MPAIRNPIEWAADELRQMAQYLETVGHSVGGTQVAPGQGTPTIRRIQVADLRDVLAKGLDDFGACRSDVVFIGLLYPIIGIVLVYATFQYDMIPLLFPLASGFALIGPVAGIGLYELSRRREQGQDAGWVDLFTMVRWSSFGALVVLSLMLLGIFLLWLAAAQAIYALTLGPEPPVSLGAFFSDVFTTSAGWAMIVLGCGVGFLFAVVVLTVSVVSFPMLVDRDVGVKRAVATSMRAVLMNPGPMAAWGLIVAGGLALGMLPLFVGLIVVVPVLGHATWHLYRKVVV